LKPIVSERSSRATWKSLDGPDDSVRKALPNKTDETIATLGRAAEKPVRWTKPLRGGCGLLAAE
jgi:hypothetical protein